ncbi:FxSxx-COOH system tetratricopeptide repeat protein [Micromonospora sp. NPDC049089]|uniref:FxSxx-COOH system tetratricopeptide repeat protein n=1 Tax=Micromonospora sp. NPDC049089 TaxID=3155496 RepID=UPI0033D6E6C1
MNTTDDDARNQIDPTSAATLADLARFMKILRLHADSPTYRDLEKRAMRLGRSLPRATLGEVLAGRRFPSKAFLLTFVELCGIDPARDRRWEQAWNRLVVIYKFSGATVAEGEVEPVLPAEETITPHGGDDLARAVREAVEALRRIGEELAQSGQRDLAGRVLNTSFNLQNSPLTAGVRPAASDEQDPVGLLGDAAGGGVAGGVPGPGTSSWSEVRRAPRQSVGGSENPGAAEPKKAIEKGRLPAVWRMEPRNPDFTGRDAVLVSLRRRLQSGGAAVVQALRGLGGVGKTQIAVEYAHRFATAYDVVWWISAEDSSLIGEQLLALGVELGLVKHGDDVSAAAPVVKAHLRGRERWLLVFDNAEDPSGLREWLPGGPGHVIITSRASGWEHLAAVVSVDVMARVEAVALLRNHHSDLDESEAEELAQALGDLPLALAQAAGFLAETATSVNEYLHLLTEHSGAVLSEGRTGDYPRPLAAAIELSTAQLAATDPVALGILRVCAFFAPDAIPVRWLSNIRAQRADLEGELIALATAVNNPVAVRRSVGVINRFGLATVSRDGLRLHRLVQSIIRHQIPADRVELVQKCAREILVSLDPGDPEDPSLWPQWAAVIPHLMALDPATADDQNLKRMICAGTWYLIEQGASDTSSRLAGEIYQRWHAAAGSADFYTMWMGRCLARALREQGRYENARKIYEDTLPFSRRELGDDHPDTLRLAHGCAINLRMLGRYHDARDLQQDTLERYRMALGVDHPHTLHSANHLAVDFSEIGDFDRARELHEQTLSQYRRVLGEDHPDTLRSANNLAVDMRNLGQHEQARRLQEDTLARRRRVLGEDHPYTLHSANSLSETLYISGRYESAWQMLEDVFGRYVRLLGEGHPDALRAARNLAETLHQLGHDERARELQENTLARYRSVLGDGHPETVRTAAHLVKILTALGLYDEAREITVRLLEQAS